MKNEVTTVWKCPITHLMADDKPGVTLCGVTTNTFQWDSGGGSWDDQDIEDGIACSCFKCKKIAQKMLEKENDA